MDNTIVENIAFDYKQLAREVVQANESYLKLLNLYKAVAISPDSAELLREADKSPNQVINALEKDSEKLKNALNNLCQAANDNVQKFGNNLDRKKLEDIAHDSKLMQKFLVDMNLSELEEMFMKLNIGEPRDVN